MKDKNKPSMREALKTIKALKKNLGDFDPSDPQAFMDGLGIDTEKIEKEFQESFNRKMVLEYSCEDKTCDLVYQEFSAGTGIIIKTNENIVIPEHSTGLVTTGIKLSIPRKYELQLRNIPEVSGARNFVVVGPTTIIDVDGEKEIGVVVINLGITPINLIPGTAIARGVLTPIVPVDEVEMKRIK